MAKTIELRQNPIFLVSSASPGSGSSSLAEGLKKEIENRIGARVHYVSIGQMVRDRLGAKNEAELQRGQRQGQVHSLRQSDFDAEVYGSLPEDQVVVVDGKLATTDGPALISSDSDRPIVAIDIYAPKLINAHRLVRKEGGALSGDEGYRSSLLEAYQQVERRTEHDLGMRSRNFGKHDRRVTRYHLDSGRFAVQELVGNIIDGTMDPNKAPRWEIDALDETYLKLIEMRYKDERTMREEDKIHFDHQIEGINYGINRLSTTTNSKGLAKIRGDLRKSIIDCWFGLMMTKIPRFNRVKDSEGVEQLQTDNSSQKWSPEFYKVAEGWPTIRAYLRDKTVLDPFAGPGAMMNLLVARGIVDKAIYTDLFYSSTKEGRRYDPLLNTEAGLLLFDALPSWYKPDISVIKGYAAADARRLPLKDKAVDFVFGDPPYGKNHSGPGIGVLFGAIDELKRVSREGAILMVPITWVEDLRAAGHVVDQLTDDLSNGKSGFPVCYIHIKKEREPEVLPASQVDI